MDALKVGEHLGSIILVSVDDIANLCLDDALVHLIDKQESFNLLFSLLTAKTSQIQLLPSILQTFSFIIISGHSENLKLQMS